MLAKLGFEQTSPVSWDNYHNSPQLQKETYHSNVKKQQETKLVLKVKQYDWKAEDVPTPNGGD